MLRLRYFPDSHVFVESFITNAILALQIPNIALSHRDIYGYLSDITPVSIYSHSPIFMKI